METETKSEVQKLLERAVGAAQAHEAMQLSQAALNAAHALQVVKQTA